MSVQLEPNVLFDEKYRLVKKLGQGGYSEVWLATDEKARINVALKIYVAGSGLDESGIRTFMDEFSLVFNLNHSNLLRPAYYGEVKGVPYLVLSYCEQGSAKSLIGRMKEEQVWRFIRDVASGLRYLHSCTPEIIHQDIKPENILISADGSFMITDFGVSSKVRQTLRKSMPNASFSGGTTAFMSPERFGEDKRPIKASDIWALGATIYEIMCEDTPFGDNGGLTQKAGSEIPKVYGEYSEKLKKTVRLCLSQNPWDRPTLDQLVELAEKELRGASDVKPTEVISNKRMVMLLWTILGIAIFIIIGSYTLSVFKGGEHSEMPEEIPEEIVHLGSDSLADVSLSVSERHGDTGSISQVRKHQNMQLDEKKKPVNMAQKGDKSRIHFSLGLESFKEIINGVSFEMVAIEGGSFMMGSNDGYENEKPVHRVTISDFYMGKTEVTQALWKAVMGDNPSNFRGDNLPVESVSWEGVHEFIKELNRLTGKKYRLPTEAEWEYAAGGGLNKRTKYVGTDAMQSVSNYAWYDSNSGGITHEVATKFPNSLGLYDMSGNVREWCGDWYGRYSINDQVNPTGASSGLCRVARGGSWYNFLSECCIHDRYTPGHASYTLGLRLSLVP